MPSVLQAGCPSCHPDNGIQALKGKQYYITRTSLPQAHVGSYNLVFGQEELLITLWKVAKSLVSPLTPVPHFFS